MKRLSAMKKLMSSLHRDQGGNVLMLVGLSAAALLGAMGLAVDYARVQYASERLQQSMDVAALAGGHRIGQNRTAMQQKAQQYLNANFNPNRFNLRNSNGTRMASAPLINVSGVFGGNAVSDQQVTFSVNNVLVGNYFMPAAEVAAGGNGNSTRTSNIGAVSSTIGLRPKPNLDIVFALDASGSMNWRNGNIPGTARQCLAATSANHPAAAAQGWHDDCSVVPAGQQSRIVAAKGRVNTFMGQLPDSTRFGLVPWSSMVNTSGVNAAGLDSGSCGDAVPSPTRYLTPAPAARGSLFNGFVAAGQTDSALGMMWAVNMFTNPNRWGAVQGPRTSRAIILMTDGVNTRFYDTGGGCTGTDFNNNRGLSNTRTSAICDTARANGIQIFTIRYNIANPTVGGLVPAGIPLNNAIPDMVAMLRNCSSPGGPAGAPSNGRHYYEAANAAALGGVLNEIARSFVSLRLTD